MNVRKRIRRLRWQARMRWRWGCHDHDAMLRHLVDEWGATGVQRAAAPLSWGTMTTDWATRFGKAVGRWYNAEPDTDYEDESRKALRLLYEEWCQANRPGGAREER